MIFPTKSSASDLKNCREGVLPSTATAFFMSSFPVVYNIYMTMSCDNNVMQGVG